MMKLAEIAQRTFVGLETHAQLFTFTFDHGFGHPGDFAFGLGFAFATLWPLGNL